MTHRLPKPTLRAIAGCWLRERWHTELALSQTLSRLTGVTWPTLRNRHEHLVPGSDNVSWVCNWDDSSWLTIARVFPTVGGRLLRRCLADWPLRFGETPARKHGERPAISVILPVMGAERLPLFRAVLASFLGQDENRMEIIVVEQGAPPIYGAGLPDSVTHLVVRPKDATHEFNKSMLLNAAVRRAAAPVVLLHDADVVVPRSYVRSVVGRISAGWDAVRPIRFLFCLERKPSEALMECGNNGLPTHVDAVQQNNPGLSVALTRERYWEIGGHDERFIGWGGEDVEFLERLKTTRLFAGSYAPAIHLWHSPAAKKASGDRNAAAFDRITRVPVAERIEYLRQVQLTPE